MSSKARATRRQRAPRLAEAAALFAALGDPTRLDLVARLSTGGPVSISRLSEGASVTRQAVTKHLQVLEEVGLARSERVGRDRVWELESGRLVDVHRWLDHIGRQWDDALARLKAAVERG